MFKTILICLTIFNAGARLTKAAEIDFVAEDSEVSRVLPGSRKALTKFSTRGCEEIHYTLMEWKVHCYTAGA